MKKSNSERCKEWRRLNPEKASADNKRRRKRLDNRELCYWKRLIGWIKSRCENQSWSARNYRDRGIECRLTLYDVVRVWFRDNAWMLKSPQMDRIDPEGHYEMGNVRFIERSENLARRRTQNATSRYFNDDTQPTLNNGREPGED